jgi:hypothetical protein
MKVRLLLDVSEHDRLVIAKFFGAASTETRDKVRRRATRKQVQRFARHAIGAVVKDHVLLLRGKSKAAAARLAAGVDVVAPDPLPEPAEKQLTLL